MPALSEYPNVFNTALLVIQQKGFRVWLDKADEWYGAERDGWEFKATSPIALLGLIAIFEHHQPKQFREYWWRIDEPMDFHSLPDVPPDFVPIYKRPDGRAP